MELARSAAAEDLAPAALVEEASRGLTALIQTRSKGNLQEIYEFADDWMADLVARMDGRTPKGLMTGFSRFDRMTQGFKPGNLIVLAARPGIGKTALLLNWLLYMAQRGNRCAAFILEMSKEEVLGRLVSTHGQINLKEAIANGYDQDVVDRIARAKAEVADLPIFIADRATITVREIRAQAERIIAKEGRLDFVAVDYLQLLSSPERGKVQNEAIRIGEITRGLKLLAKDLGLPVVLLSQMNREVEHRQNGRPQLSDLRDSGTIEQDADLVAFIHRRMVALREGEAEDSAAELIVAKQRDGRLGSINLHFDGPSFRYREMDRTTAAAPQLTRRA
jgi:replicative DNA helicase